MFWGLFSARQRPVKIRFQKLAAISTVLLEYTHHPSESISNLLWDLNFSQLQKRFREQNSPNMMTQNGGLRLLRLTVFQIVGKSASDLLKWWATVPVNHRNNMAYQWCMQGERRGNKSNEEKAPLLLHQLNTYTTGSQERLRYRSRTWHPFCSIAQHSSVCVYAR